MLFYIRVPSLITPVHCITITEEPDLPISGQPVYLQVNRRQFKCDNCRKPFSEELDFVAKKRTYTKRLAENILEQLKAGDILNVSRRNDVTEEEIQKLLDTATLLVGLPPETIDKVTSHVVTRTHPPNRAILLENDWGFSGGQY